MIKQLIPKNFCLDCQGCCRFAKSESVWSPILLNEEKKNYSTGVIRLIRDKKQDIFLCEFLAAADNKCKIYDSRPFDCQLYPFLINRKAQNIFLSVDLKCPYIQKRLKNGAFRKYARYLTGFLSGREGRRFLEANPQIIQEYPEALILSEIKINP